MFVFEKLRCFRGTGGEGVGGVLQRPYQELVKTAVRYRAYIFSHEVMRALKPKFYKINSQLINNLKLWSYSRNPDLTPPIFGKFQLWSHFWQ
jgi:hypothetical protein